MAAGLREQLSRTVLPALTAASLVAGERAAAGAAATAQPLQLFHMLLRKRRLLGRPGVAAAISAEAAALAKLVQAHVVHVGADAQRAVAERAAVEALTWLKQARSKVGVAARLLAALVPPGTTPPGEVAAAHAGTEEVLRGLQSRERVRRWHMGFAGASLASSHE